MDSAIDIEWEMSSSCCVEASGWDAAENFFVEIATLQLGHDESKQITLQATVGEGSVIFVRLLHQVANANTIPLAYRVSKVVSRDPKGRTTVGLAQLYPHTSSKAPSKNIKCEAPWVC